MKFKYVLVLGMFLMILLSSEAFAAQNFRGSNPPGFSGGISSGYSGNWQSYQPTFNRLYSGNMNNYWPILSQMENDQCNATSDFIIGIPPGGCSPAVVRSDLLSEQNVPVFCQLYAIKVNPLIKTSSIKSISFKGGYPEGVRSIVFHPARAAVRSYRTLLGDPTINNIGYVVIILKQNRIEKNMPEWVAGNLTATIRYDAEEVYGTGASEYYLPDMNENDWDSDYMASSFWRGRGFLKAENIDNGRATINILTDKDRVIKTFNLKEGETSPLTYLPGYYCRAGLKIKLNRLVAPEDKALLNIDGQNIWVREGTRFLNGKCSVKNLKVNANNEGDIDIRCNGAGKINTLSLKKSGVKLEDENGNVEEYKVGDKVGEDYIIGYGTTKESKKEFIVLAKEMPDKKDEKKIFDKINSLRDGNDITELLDLKSPNLLLKETSIDKYTFKGLSSGMKEKKYEGKIIDEYFELANDTINDLIDIYKSEEKANGETYGEEALYEQIVLAQKTGKIKTKAALMDLFIDKYPSSKSIEDVRNMRQKLDGTDFENSLVNIYVGDKFRSISVVDFKSVDEGERKVDLRIGSVPRNGLNEGNETSLGRDKNLTILKILPGKVQIHFKSDKEKVRDWTGWVLEGKTKVFDGVEIYVKNIEINEIAYVSIIPEVKWTKTEADFTFKIGIEKRAIQLSPEKAKEMLKNINGSIVRWEKIVEKLGNVVKGLKGACFATSAYLTIKNMISGTSGEALARQKVMKEYKIICNRDYSEMTKTECYNELSDEIDGNVSKMALALNAVNMKMEEARKGNVVDSGGLFGGKSVPNNKKLKEALRKQIDGDFVVVNVGGEEIKVPKGDIDSVSQLRAVLLNQELKDKVVIGDVARIEMDNSLRNSALAFQQKEERDKDAKKLEAEWGTSKLDSSDIGMIPDDKPKYIQWTNKKGSFFSVPKEDSDSKVQIVKANNDKDYLAVLGSVSKGGYMRASKVYKNVGGKWEITNEIDNELKRITFSSVFSSGCSNPWPKKDAEVRYYEYGNNKGLPAIVPFDLTEGWYASIPNSGGTFLDNSPQGYTASADVRYFKICNIGSNGLMQNGVGDDLCQSFDVNTIGSVDEFIPCKEADVKKLYNKAREAIRRASTQYGQKNINIFDEMIKVGEPMSQIGGFECQDFMSPKDCLLMFNVCDPVICPPSRCDLGGKMPVSDVIQTGIIGSIALCLPNAKEGIKVPICLSGIQAGLDAYVSILKSEADCLQKNIDTGELVGICDEITSIYKCEFFWKQLTPVMDQLIPSLIASSVSPGERIRGGGEYALVQQSWNTMRQSVSYFKNVYAQNAFRAFNIRSTQEVGGTFCKAFVGTSVPSSANILDSLLEPESPTQFYAQFSETLFTEATVPATSQYKVYYHIYAGNDQGIQYKVYLKNPPKNSYYSSNPSVMVKSGYIAKGSSADKTIDFTAPTGYKELCVVINAREECGFKQSTTDFALNYIKNKFVEEQAKESDITSEKECISGSPSALSMVNLNLQASVEEMANPEIALRGIVRICASRNPGTGTDQKNFSRWKDVGYCGNNSMRCWLDTDSVKEDLEKIEAIEGTTSNILNERRNLIEKKGLLLKDVQELLASVRDKIKGLKSSDLSNPSEDEGKVNKIIVELDRVIGTDKEAGAGTNNDRAEALALKANIYEMVVIEVLKDGKAIAEPTSQVDEEENGTTTYPLEEPIIIEGAPIADKSEGGDVKRIVDGKETIFFKSKDRDWRTYDDATFTWDKKTLKWLVNINGLFGAKDYPAEDIDELLFLNQEIKDKAKELIEDKSSKDIEKKDNAVGFISVSYNPNNNINTMYKYIYYAKENKIGGKQCYCGNDCNDYADWIFKYSNENEIEPLLLLSLMIQESECITTAKSSNNAFGLTQITSVTFGDYCDDGKIPGVTRFNDIIGPQNTEKNIECGALVLKAKYNDYGNGIYNSYAYRKKLSSFVSMVNSCIKEYPKYKDYTSWIAALRGYNGWGCGSGADVDYVENIIEKYSELNTIPSSGTIQV